MIEPLRLELDVACPPEHAFATWTERFGHWWPRSHTVSGEPSAVVLEPRLGGRIYERTADGREIDWGEVTGWEPPHRCTPDGNDSAPTAPRGAMPTAEAGAGSSRTTRPRAVRTPEL